MRISELQNKDVVDITSGEKIGNVIDIEIENETGNILSMIIFGKKSLFNILSSGEEVTIKWDQIKKIGSDVILVAKKL